ncbi:unnamed protein product, partial [Owenia fusiformis]
MASRTEFVLLVALTIWSSTNADTTPPFPLPGGDIICPDGYDAIGGSCLMYSRTPKNFTDASKVCDQDGGTLFSITSMDEAESITNEMLNNPEIGPVWLGLEKDPYERWSWSDDTPYLTAPLNTRDCGAIDPETGFFISEECDTTAPYICEWGTEYRSTCSENGPHGYSSSNDNLDNREPSDEAALHDETYASDLPRTVEDIGGEAESDRPNGESPERDEGGESKSPKSGDASNKSNGGSSESKSSKSSGESNTSNGSGGSK